MQFDTFRRLLTISPDRRIALRDNSADLKQDAVFVAKSMGLSAVATTFIHFLQAAVLAKLLRVSDFGLSGLCFLVVDFAAKFNIPATSYITIIYSYDDFSEDDSKSILSSVYWLNLATGLILMLILLVSSPMISKAFNQPRLNELIPYLSLTIPIAALGQHSYIFLKKGIMHAKLAKIEVLSAFVGAFVAICSALLGQEVFSFIWGQIATVTAKTFMVFISCLKVWKPSLHFNIADLKSKVFKNSLTFGLYRTGEQLVNYLRDNMDRLIIGALSDPSALGIYMFAHKIAISNISKINPVVLRTAYPLLSRLKGVDGFFEKGFMKMYEILNFIRFPILLLIAAAAPQFVKLFLGPRWLVSIPIIQLLALVEAFRSLRYLDEPILVIDGQASRSFYWKLAFVTMNAAGIYIGFNYGGITGIALTCLVLSILYAILGYPFVIRSVFGDCLKKYIKTIWPALWMSVLPAAAVWIGGSIFLKIFDRFPFMFRRAVFCIEIMGAAICYIVFLWFFKRDFLQELKSLVLLKIERNAKFGEKHIPADGSEMIM